MIKVILKPEKGIQIDETKKYLFDPSVVQPFVDASAENATKAEENANRAEQTFANVSTFVDTSKSEITGIIEQGKTEITTAIDDGRMEISDSILEATEEVKKAGQEAAQEAVQGAADEATRIATEQVNTYVVEVVSPQIQEFVNNAEADASNAAESAGLAAEEANKSSVSASDSQHYAEDARIWAEGEQAEVKELGGELSSMGAADLAYAIANAPEDTPIDASGLFAMNVVKGEKGDKGDKGDAGKDGVDGKDGLDTFATNCITEIPQRIKYTLEDGTLSVKAGTVAIIPYGTEDLTSQYPKGATFLNDNFKVYDTQFADGKFFVWTELQNDVVANGPVGSFTEKWVFGCNKQGGFYWEILDNCYSGSSLPAQTGYNRLGYNTATNKMQGSVNGGNYVDTEDSFPALIFTTINGIITSIDHVFNGIGYIGSTVWVDKGVKGLIPNGRNTDGSLNNVEFETDKILTCNVGTTTNALCNIIYYNGDITVWSTKLYNYDEYKNLFLWFSNNSYYSICELGSFYNANGVISDFSPKTVFHAVDRNDSSWVSAQAMPSGKYIDLTLGATGTAYTAPANGYIKIVMSFTPGTYCYICDDTYKGSGVNSEALAGHYERGGQSSTGGVNYGYTVSVRKGQVIKIIYTTSLVAGSFQFIYAEGEK